ncbi:MAG: protein kinase [Pseudomonadota bacterium]
MDPERHFNALKQNEMLHWYEIKSILGQGGFGITYLARDTNLDQMVAIKEYLPTEFSTRDVENTVQPISQNHTQIFDWGKKRFLDEAKTLAQFRHPNVVRVSSFFENNNTGYMVMDYEEGTDLSVLIKAGEKFNEERLLGILLPILDGLEQIHSQGFIHRDIKPANIFLRNDGSPVLIDFGSARQSVGGQTRTMTSLVTPGYAPFEQYHDAEGKQGPWTDIYSLGASCCALITGKPPTDALKRSMAKLDHGTDIYVDLVDLYEGKYSQHVLRAIDYALEFRESDRPQSIKDWRPILLGEVAAPAAEPVTQINTSPSAATQIVTPIDSQTAPTAPTVSESRTRPEPVKITPTPEAAEAAPAAEKKGTTNLLLIAVAVLLLVVIGGGVFIMQSGAPTPVEQAQNGTNTSPEQTLIQPETQPEDELTVANVQQSTDTQTSETTEEPETPATSQEQTEDVTQKAAAEEEANKLAEAKRLQEEQANQAALKKEQERIAAEKKKLAEEQAQLAAAKKKQAEEQAQLAAAKKKQAEEEAKKQEAARLAKLKAEEEKKAQEAAAAKQQASKKPADFRGTYIPDEGFEAVVLNQNGDVVRGTIGTEGSTLEGKVVGNKLTFSFLYSLTGYGHKPGTGEFTLDSSGRLSGFRSEGGFDYNTPWNLTRNSSAKTKSADSSLFKNLSGTYKPDEGFEYLVLKQTGNKIKGEIGTEGSTLSGERNGNVITFKMQYSKTGYGHKPGFGEFSISADGKRLTGKRSKAGFADNSPWNLTRIIEN